MFIFLFFFHYLDRGYVHRVSFAIVFLEFSFGLPAYCSPISASPPRKQRWCHLTAARTHGTIELQHLFPDVSSVSEL